MKLTVGKKSIAKISLLLTILTILTIFLINFVVPILAEQMENITFGHSITVSTNYTNETTTIPEETTTTTTSTTTTTLSTTTTTRKFSVKDSKGTTIKSTIRLKNPTTQDLITSVLTNEEMMIDDGEYNVEIVPENHPVKEIRFENIELNGTIEKFVDLDDTPENIPSPTEVKEWIEVYAIDPTGLNFTEAEVTVTAKGNVLYKCKDWNFTEQSCYSEWIKLMDITPGENYTFTLTPEDPGFGEANITIINVQSYPTLYGNWTVEFTTIGTANLTVTAVNGTEFGRDIEFLELRCGDNVLTTELTDGVVFVENYYCDETGYEISEVLIAGGHTLEFRFGDDVKYAYNQVGNIRLKTVEFFINTSKTQVAASAWFNNTFRIQLPESGIIVKSAWFEIFGVFPNGTAGGRIENYINGTLLVVQNITNTTGHAGNETFGFTYLVNGTNRTTAPSGGLYGITDDTARAFVLSLRPLNAAYNALSAKAVVTYAYNDSSAIQLHTEQFFVNQSANAANLASGAWFNSTFKVHLAGTSPSVKSAWFEVGTSIQHNSALQATLDVVLNGSQAHVSPYNVTAGPATAETALIVLNANASSAATSIYAINDNTERVYALGLRITNEVSTAHHAKLYVTYTTSTVNQTTHEIFVNSTGPAVAANTFVNWTFPVQLFGNSPKVRSAWFEIYGGMVDSTTKQNISVFINGTLVLGETITNMAFSESDGFRIFANATKIINEVTDNSRRMYRLDIRCRGVQCNALSAKLIITYNFTSLPNQTTVKFFINSSNVGQAVNAFFNSTFNVQLPEYTPSVQRAFYDIVGNMGGLTDLTLRAKSGHKNITFDDSLWDSSGADTPFYMLHSVYNATNSTTAITGTPYEITDNNAHTYDLSLQCTGSACFNLGSKLVMLYSFSTVAPDTTPPTWTNAQDNSSYKVYRGQVVNISTEWSDTVGLSKSWLSTNETGVWKNYTDTTGAYPIRSINGQGPALANWTWQNQTGKPRPIGWIIYANDTSKNENGTNSPGNMIRNFTMWGWSNITWTSPSPGSSYSVGSTIQLRCFVNDTNTTGSGPITGYDVNFYNRTATSSSLLGVNFTNGTSITSSDGGYVTWNWNTSGLPTGTYYPICNITSNSTLYYNASEFYQANTTITLTPPAQNYIQNITEAVLFYSQIPSKSSFGRRQTQPFSILQLSPRLQALIKPLTQTFDIPEKILRIYSGIKALIQSISYGEIVAKLRGTTKAITQAIGYNELAARLYSGFRNILQTINYNELVVRIRTVPRNIVQAITYNELVSRIRNVTKTIAQIINYNELATRIRSVSRFLTQTVGYNELIIRIYSSLKALAQTITYNQTITRLYSGFKNMLQSINYGEVATRVLGSLRTAVQIINYNEAIKRLSAVLKTITQSVSHNDLVARLRAVSRALTQAVSYSDVGARLYSTFKAIAQAVNYNELTIKFVTFTKSMIQIINYNETITRITGFFRINTIFISVVETVSRTVIVGIQHHLRTIIQSFDVNEMITRLRSVPRAITQSIAYSEIVQKIYNGLRSLTQSIAYNELMVRLRIVPRNLMQALSVNEITSRIVAFSRVLTQSLIVDSVVRRIYASYRTLIQTLSVTDLVSRIYVGSRVLTQVITTSDVVIRLRSIARALSQSFDVATITSRLTEISRVLTQSLITSDIAIRLRIISRALDQSLSLNSVIIRLSSMTRLLNQSLTTNYVITRLKLVSRTLSQILMVNMLVTRMTSISRLITQSLTTNVAITYIRTVLRNTAEQVALTDLVSRLITFSRTLSESILVNTTVTRLVALIKSTTQPLGVTALGMGGMVAKAYEKLVTLGITISDALLRIFYASRTITGYFAITDFVTRLGGISKTLSQTINLTSVVERVKTVSRALSQTFSINALTIRFRLITRTIAQSLDLTIITSRVTNIFRSIVERILLMLRLIIPCEVFISQTSCEAAGCYWCNNACQSVSCPTPPAPAPSIGYAPPPAIVPPPEVYVSYTKIDVLREIAPGRTALVGINVKNIKEMPYANLSVEVTGVPSSWVSVSPPTLNLKALESKGFNVLITPPADAEPGDYKVTLKLKNIEIEAENFYILRVKSVPVDYDKPIVSRSVTINKDERRTNIELIISNPYKEFEQVEIIENIPKEIANSTDYVNFETTPTEIITKDPVVLWSIPQMKVGEEKRIFYSVSKILDEFTQYVYWPLRQLNLISPSEPQNFKLVRFDMPRFYPGETSTVYFVIQNLDTISHNFTFSMDIPLNWQIEPTLIKETIQPGEEREFYVQLKVPYDESSGRYIIRTMFSWDENYIIKEYAAEVWVPVVPKMVVYLFVAGCSIGVSYAILRVVRKRQKFALAEKIKTIRRGVLAKPRMIEEDAIAIEKLRKELEMKKKLRRAIYGG